MISHTVTVPTGYKLLGNKPVNSYCSGNSTAYPTDERSVQSGNTVTTSIYIWDPNDATVHVSYSLLFIRA